jgi:hypothetical protein
MGERLGKEERKKAKDGIFRNVMEAGKKLIKS